MPNDHRGRPVHGGKVSDDEYAQLSALVNHVNFDRIKEKGWVTDSDVERYGQATAERRSRPQPRVVHPEGHQGRRSVARNWDIDSPFDENSVDRDGSLYGDLSY
jgi:hypothetical protein